MEERNDHTGRTTMPTETTAQVEHQVSLELSHPTGGGGGGEQRAHLRVFDAASRLLILSVEIPPQDFYKLLAGLVDSSTLPANLLTADIYQRVGKRRWFWTRKLGYRIAEDDAQQWAETVRETLQLDAVHVDSRQGGLWATWQHWSNYLDQDDHKGIQADIDAVPPPASKP